MFDEVNALLCAPGQLLKRGVEALLA